MSRTAKKAHPTSHQRRSTPKETAVVPKDLEVPLQVPPLTAYPSLKKVEVALVDDSVTVGENIQPARPIPDSFPSTKVYLKVRAERTLSFVPTSTPPNGISLLRLNVLPIVFPPLFIHFGKAIGLKPEFRLRCWNQEREA